MENSITAFLLHLYEPVKLQFLCVSVQIHIQMRSCEDEMKFAQGVPEMMRQ